MNTDKGFESKYSGGTGWGESDIEQVLELFTESKRLVQEDLEVSLAYELGKPEINTDDPDERMLESECYRFTFEEESILYKEMKENQRQYRDKVGAFIKENILFHAFVTIEKYQTLCDDYEVFKRYGTWESVVHRFQEIQDKLEEKGFQFLSTVLPHDLERTIRPVG